MRPNAKWTNLALSCALALGLAACEDDGTGPERTTPDAPADLVGTITGHRILRADTVYTIKGIVTVDSGAVLTIEPGTLILGSTQVTPSALIIRRGGKIIADGRPDAPIVFTSDKPVGQRARGDWGGIVINGLSTCNFPADQCVGEGSSGPYGGNDPEDSSGILRYVRIEFAGYEVSFGNELNALTLNGVGSGTIIEYVQAHYGSDDGIEFFGGAVNVDHFVALYVKDDSIDFSDGYVGTIDTALIIQPELDGNRCIEGDNIGDTRAASGVPLDTEPMTKPTIRNMTCIIGNGDMNTHDPAEGPTLRRGPQMTLVDSIIYGAYADDIDSNNECFEIDEDGVTDLFAQQGLTSVRNTLIVCELAVQTNHLPNGDTLEEWFLGANPSTNGADYSFNVGNVIIQRPDVSANANLAILDLFYTRPDLVDADGNPLTMTPESDRLGAVTRENDWTIGWTYGLHEENRGQPLWFEAP